MRLLVLGALMCCVLVSAQKFYFDDIHVMIPTYEPKQDIIKLVADLNDAGPKEQKQVCRKFMTDHSNADQAANRTKDCIKIVDQIANVKLFTNYIYSKIESSGIVDRDIQIKVREIYTHEDQKFNHDSVPAGSNWCKKIDILPPPDKREAFNATVRAAAEEFAKQHGDIGEAMYGFHHPKDEEYYNRDY